MLNSSLGLRITALIAVSALLLGTANAQSVMRIGGWKIKQTLLAKNQESGKYNVVVEDTSTLCLSSAFLANDPYLTPRIYKERAEKKGRGQCAMSDAHVGATSASWKMMCTGADGSQTEMAFKTIASPTTLTSEIDSLIKKKGEVDFLTKVLLEGMFVGKCTADMPPMQLP